MVGALSRRPVENYVGILMLKFSSYPSRPPKAVQLLRVAAPYPKGSL